MIIPVSISIVMALPEGGEEKKYWRKPLDFHKHKVPIGKVIIIAERCKACKYCIEFCPKDILVESEERNKKGYKIPKVVEGMEEECIVCRHCEDICPEFGIYIEEIEEEEEEEDDEA